jgi:hypothetical protein
MRFQSRKDVLDRLSDISVGLPSEALLQHVSERFALYDVRLTGDLWMK